MLADTVVPELVTAFPSVPSYELLMRLVQPLAESEGAAPVVNQNNTA